MLRHICLYLSLLTLSITMQPATAASGEVNIPMRVDHGVVFFDAMLDEKGLTPSSWIPVPRAR